MPADGRPAVLFVHADELVFDLVNGALGDEFHLVHAPEATVVVELAGKRAAAVVVIDGDLADANAGELADELRAKDPHVRAIFLVGSDEPTRAFRLADHGAVVPRRMDLDRLRLAIRNACRLRDMHADVDRLRAGTARTPNVGAPGPRDGSSSGGNGPAPGSIRTRSGTVPRVASPPGSDPTPRPDEGGSEDAARPSVRRSSPRRSS